MSSIFVDRESAYPNRYRVIPENGNAYYVILERADEPVTPGTPLNAETFNGMRREIDADLAGKAPAGFGLGEDNLPLVEDINDCTTPGFYRTSPDTKNLPDDSLNCATVIVTRRDSEVVQNLQRTNGGAIMNRYYIDGAWLSEWVTPPLQTGVEYRTTERYQGRAVYKKVDAKGNILWRKYGESTWHLLSSASGVSAATVE
jgi:hypothetical protein